MAQASGLRRLVNRHWQTLVVVGLFFLLTALAAWPILAHLDTVLVGNDVDVSLNPWADWWTAKALSDPALSLWETDYLFYPEGVTLYFHSFSHLNSAVSLLLRPLVGRIPAYNLTILLNYVLIGLSMFHLARYVTGSFAASLLAALVFAFNSHAIYQSSHPDLLTIWPLPWAALYLARSLREGRHTFALVASLFSLLAALGSTLILVLQVLWLGLVILFLIVRRELHDGWWHSLTLFVVTSMLLCLPVVAPLLKASFVGGDWSFVMSQAETTSTDIASFFFPRWFRVWNKGLYLGFIPLTLLIMARYRREAMPWYFLLLVAVFFAVGPYPSLARHRLNVVLPWTFLVIPLLRHSYRINIIISLALAMLSAFGWLSLTQGLGRNRRYALLLVFAALIYIDYVAPSFPATPFAVSPFYSTFLPEVPEDVAVATLPAGHQIDKRYLLYQTYHGHRMTNGHVSRQRGERLRYTDTPAFLGSAVEDTDVNQIPADPEASLARLANIGVGYLILDKLTGLDIEAWRRAMPWAPVYEDNMVLVYATRLLRDWPQVGSTPIVRRRRGTGGRALLDSSP